MLGELLAEIAKALPGTNPLDFDRTTAEALLADFMACEKTFVVLAHAEAALGFIAMYESHAAYAGGRSAPFRSCT